jgi:hypothetical protein
MMQTMVSGPTESWKVCKSVQTQVSTNPRKPTYSSGIVDCKDPDDSTTPSKINDIYFQNMT